MVNERFKKVREYLGLSQRDLARELGITERTVRNYEVGKIEVPKTIILALQALFNINPNWLLTGQGEMFLKKEEGSKYIGSAVGTESNVQNIGTIIGENVKVIKSEKGDYIPASSLKGTIRTLLEQEVKILEQIEKENPSQLPKAIKKLEADIKQLEELFLT